MRFYFPILMFCFLVAACSKRDQPPKAAPSSVSPPASMPVSAAIDVEPPEQVLRDLMFRQYAEIAAGGGMPVTLTATGEGGKLRTKLYEVHKDKCAQNPVDPPGVYECDVDLMVTLWWEGRQEPSKPLADSKRISVVRGANGVWIDCAFDPDNLCTKGVRK